MSLRRSGHLRCMTRKRGKPEGAEGFSSVLDSDSIRNTMLLILSCLLLLSAVVYTDRAETTGVQATTPPASSQSATDRILTLVERHEFENAELEAKKLTSQRLTSAKGYQLLGY